MFWAPIAFIGLAGLLTLFVVSTDGRYFGKKVSYFMYNQLGPLRFFSSRDNRKWETLISLLDLRGGEKILDVGTAVGRLPLIMAQEGGFDGRIIGVDWSPRMIAVARSKARELGLSEVVDFRVLDVRGGLPFESGSFDVVLCLGLLETLQDPGEVLAELARIAGDDGTIVLSFYHGAKAWGYSIPYEWYLRNLASIGLDVVERVSYGSRYDFVIAKARPVIAQPQLLRNPRGFVAG
jgi:ubiquinone/menaquinone biosynthesis C-methylase UbiE